MMNNDEAREIVWDFKESILKDFKGPYYDSLRLALDQLRDVSIRYDECLEIPSNNG